MTISGPSDASRVAVVVASIDARRTAVSSLARFAREVQGRGEVVLVDASRDGSAAEVAREVAGVRVIVRPAGTLAPELWRDGLLATDAPLVAFSTAAMVPAPGWLDALLAGLTQTNAAAVGGPIEESPELGATDRAVYLQRYVNYLRPLPTASAPPGENAVYRRDRLGPWTAGGFWESEIQHNLRDRGERLAMAPDAVVTYQGGASLASALGQRFRHARRYGAGRTSALGIAARLARASAAPMVPAVMSARIARALRVRGQSFAPWLTATPALAALLAAWAAGEAIGTLAGAGTASRGFGPVRTRARERRTGEVAV